MKKSPIAPSSFKLLILSGIMFVNRHFSYPLSEIKLSNT